MHEVFDAVLLGNDYSTGCRVVQVMCKGKSVTMIMMMIVTIVIPGTLKYIKMKHNLSTPNREKTENKIITNREAKSFALHPCDEI